MEKEKRIQLSPPLADAAMPDLVSSSESTLALLPLVSTWADCEEEQKRDIKQRKPMPSEAKAGRFKVRMRGKGRKKDAKEKLQQISMLPDLKWLL